MVGPLSVFRVTHDQAIAVTALVCGTPKRARLTREVFTSTLGRTVWKRGIVPLDASALRRLDRIDTVALDAGVLLTGAHVLGGLEPTEDAVESESELRLRAAELLDPDHPKTVRRDAGWTLGPLGQVATVSSGTRAASRRVRRHGGTVLCAEPELDGLAPSLARRRRAPDDSSWSRRSGRCGGCAARRHAPRRGHPRAPGRGTLGRARRPCR